MTAYYNEIDPYCAEWLRNLMREGLIADGHVDTRSIQDITPNDLAGFAQCHFFAGIGGWSHALRLAAWPDHRPVWTGSCPCQPFSLAGRQGGFADERHLWPAFRYLIAQCGPAVVLGEQVAFAADWLRLVRGDLEALGYAVGCMPIQAASAGADHLRDRYWFVAHAVCDGSGDGAGSGYSPQEATVGIDGGSPRPGAAAGFDGSSGVALAYADDAGSQGRRLLPECAGERIAGADGVADADSLCGEVNSDAGGSPHGSGAGTITGFSSSRAGDVENPDGRRQCGPSVCAQQPRRTKTQRPSEDLQWVIGADGKARRVKSGIRLLAYGVPARVGKLRGFGNAIDPRPAAAFIKAVM